MSEQEFLEKRAFLVEKKERLRNEINVEYTEHVSEFVNHNSPVEDFKVYELVENGKKRRGYSRFVIYTQEVGTNLGVTIRVGGWWLNKENVPEKWGVMCVYGIGNAAVFKLSENQINQKHPESNDSN